MNDIYEWEYPLVIVGTLRRSEQTMVANFLSTIQLPVYIEATSGLRELPQLQPWRLYDPLFTKHPSYPVNSVIRIGGVPTTRLWRDLENQKEKLKILSFSDLQFSGLSWMPKSAVAPMAGLYEMEWRKHPYAENTAIWLREERLRRRRQVQQWEKGKEIGEPTAVHRLSRLIPHGAMIYLGNSQPIRHWDLAATDSYRRFTIQASRGLNGIDGQVSTFLGLCQKGINNWGIFGDLTFLYDMAGPWILAQRPGLDINIVVINNKGGKIFSHMYASKSFQNRHELGIEPLARFWGIEYERWERVPDKLAPSGVRLIELIK